MKINVIKEVEDACNAITRCNIKNDLFKKRFSNKPYWFLNVNLGLKVIIKLVFTLFTIKYTNVRNSHNIQPKNCIFLTELLNSYVVVFRVDLVNRNFKN